MKFAALPLLFASILAVALEPADVNSQTPASTPNHAPVEVARINETPNRHDASGHKNV